MFRDDFRKVRNAAEFIQERAKQTQTMSAETFVFHHDHHLVKKRVYRGTEQGYLDERRLIFLFSAELFHFLSDSRHLSGKEFFFVILKRFGIEGIGDVLFGFLGLAQYVLNPFECRRD